MLQTKPEKQKNVLADFHNWLLRSLRNKARKQTQRVVWI